MFVGRIIFVVFCRAHLLLGALLFVGRIVCQEGAFFVGRLFLLGALFCIVCRFVGRIFCRAFFAGRIFLAGSAHFL